MQTFVLSKNMYTPTADIRVLKHEMDEIRKYLIHEPLGDRKRENNSRIYMHNNGQSKKKMFLSKNYFFLFFQYSGNYKDTKTTDVTTGTSNLIHSIIQLIIFILFYFYTSGKQLQRIIHYSVTPCRPLQSCIQRRNDPNALYDVDCDEVYSRVYIGDA